jgi:hypothetical protein
MLKSGATNHIHIRDEALDLLKNWEAGLDPLSHSIN